MSKNQKLQTLRDKLQSRTVKALGQTKSFPKENGVTIYSVWGNLWDEKGLEIGSIQVLIGFKNVLFTFNNGTTSSYNFDFKGIRKFMKKVKHMRKFSNIQTSPKSS